MRKTIENSTRELIVEKYLKNYSNKEISEIFNLSANTISTIIKLYKKTGRINKKLKKERMATILTNEFKEKIQNIIDIEPSITLKKIKEKIQIEDNIVASLSSINKAINQFSYSLKLTKLVPNRRNDADVIRNRKEYALNFSTFDQNKIVFIDETGVSISLRTKKGRSLIGTTPIRNVRQLRSKNYTICASMMYNQMLYHTTKPGSFNGLGFQNYIINLIRELRQRQMEDMIFIMDNCSIHKVLEVKNIIEQNNYNLIFLPPYCLFLNPIEESFSKFKNYVKRANCNSILELENVILNGFYSISNSDCIGYFNHMRSYIPRCILEEQINY